MKLTSALAKRQIWSEIGHDAGPFFSYYKPWSCIVVAVSWWADSILSLFVICSMVLSIGGGLDDVVVVHCNHHTRPDTDSEAAFIVDYCEWIHCQIFDYCGDDFREHVLRAWRWQCFDEVLAEYNASMVVTGHHLSDRMETSLLHLYRGCSLFGLSNMTVYDQKQSTFSSSTLSYHVYRPLLSLQKNHILALCHRFSLCFIDDPSNQDIGVSKRNFIRHCVLPILLDNTSFVVTMNRLYELTTEYFHKLCALSTLVPITISVYWEVDFAFVRNVFDRKNIDISLLVTLFKQLGRYCDSNELWLLDLCLFLRTHNCGWKLYAHTVFVLWHGRIYIFGADGCFWDKEIATVRDIATFGDGRFGDLLLTLPHDYSFWLLRFAKAGDHYRGKRLAKYLLNQKVPVFWRNYIPVLERNGDIGVVFVEQWKEQVVF